MQFLGLLTVAVDRSNPVDTKGRACDSLLIFRPLLSRALQNERQRDGRCVLSPQIRRALAVS